MGLIAPLRKEPRSYPKLTLGHLLFKLQSAGHMLGLLPSLPLGSLNLCKKPSQYQKHHWPQEPRVQLRTAAQALRLLKGGRGRDAQHLVPSAASPVDAVLGLLGTALQLPRTSHAPKPRKGPKAPKRPKRPERPQKAPSHPKKTVLCKVPVMQASPKGCPECSLRLCACPLLSAHMRSITPYWLNANKL